MTYRRLICILLVLASTLAPAANAVAQDNEAEAINTTDGALVLRVAFDLQRITQGPVDQKNVAKAYASCENCRTVAVAVQVLLLMSDIDYVVPVNYAEAINENCTLCETLAYAGQLVLSTGGNVRLTGDARRRLEEIERELNALAGSDASIAEIEAELQRLMGEVNATVVNGLEPIGAGARTPQEVASTADSDAASGSDVSPDSPDGSSGTDGSTSDGDAAAGDSTSTATAADPAPTATTEDAAPTATTETVGTTEGSTTTVEPAPADETATTTSTETTSTAETTTTTDGSADSGTSTTTTP